MEVKEEEIPRESLCDGCGIDECFREAGDEVSGEEGFKVRKRPVDGEAPASAAVGGVGVALVDGEGEGCGCWGGGGVMLAQGLGEDEACDASADDEGVWWGGGHCAGWDGGDLDWWWLSGLALALTPCCGGGVGDVVGSV